MNATILEVIGSRDIGVNVMSLLLSTRTRTAVDNLLHTDRYIHNGTICIYPHHCYWRQ